MFWKRFGSFPFASFFNHLDPERPTKSLSIVCWQLLQDARNMRCHLYSTTVDGNPTPVWYGKFPSIYTVLYIVGWADFFVHQGYYIAIYRGYWNSKRRCKGHIYLQLMAQLARIVCLQVAAKLFFATFTGRSNAKQSLSLPPSLPKDRRISRSTSGPSVTKSKTAKSVIHRFTTCGEGCESSENWSTVWVSTVVNLGFLQFGIL